MTSLAVQLGNSDGWGRHFQPLTKGVSEPAKKSVEFANMAEEHFNKPISNASRERTLINEIFETYWLAQDPGWDGYDATPISPIAVNRAIQFLDSSRFDRIPVPDVTPEPDGELALEWYGNAGSVFSISFGQTNTISYAGLYADKSKIHGVENIASVDKKILQKYISKAVSN